MPRSRVALGGRRRHRRRHAPHVTAASPSFFATDNWTPPPSRTQKSFAPRRPPADTAPRKTVRLGQASVCCEIILKSLMSHPRHPAAKHFRDSGIFLGIQDFSQLEARISALLTESERGAALEVFAEACLATQRIYQACDVWPGSSVPTELRLRLRLPSADMGIDGVFVTAADEAVCYQSKFRSGRPLLNWTELSTFFGLADGSDRKLVFTNCDDIAQVAEVRLGAIFVRGSDLDRLAAADFDIIRAWLSEQPAQPQKKQPKPHQTAALNEIVGGLSRLPRATALMACGSGKTLVALWTAERLGARTVLVLLPSLALVRQTLHEWLHETSWTEVQFLCVCSDPTVQPEEDSLVVRPSDLDFAVTTQSADVRRFLERPSTSIRLVFSTYQSSQVVKEAAAGLPSFDFCVFDEAHKTAGRSGQKFALALSDENLPIKRRLFLTATPRHYDVAKKDKFGESKIVYSMDAPDVYGPVVHRLPFSAAAKAGIISDYKVVISVVTSEMVTDDALRRGVVLVAGDEVKARQVANQIALKSAVEKYRAAKVFTFHSKVAAAKSFTSDNAEGIATHLDGFHCTHIEGSMTTAHRERLLREFAAAPRAILSNARCLTEGVDVPAVDMVAFLSPKRSLVDIVQATGRAMRRSPGKDFGYVLVPLYVEKARGETVEQAVLRSNFDEVWKVLQGLKEQDDLLAQVVAEMRIERGRTGGFDDSRFREKVEVLGPELSLETLRRTITAACLDVIGEAWLERYGQLVAYKEKHGHCDIPVRSREHKQLATWVVAQRYERRQKRLTDEQIELLNRIGFTWDPYSVEWRGNYLDLLAYREKHGSCDVPTNSKEFPKLARWVKSQRSQRQRGKISDERIEMLSKVGFTWDGMLATWEERFHDLRAYQARFGDTRVPVKWKENPDLGHWVVSQRYKRRKNRLRPEYEQRLKAIGFEWEVPRAIPGPDVWERRFVEFVIFRESNPLLSPVGAVRMTRGLASWVQDQRALKRQGKLLPERERRLQEVGFLWESSAPGSESYWRTRLAELTAYAEANGTTVVPVSDRDARSLREWVMLQRTLRRKDRLSDERIKALDAIGFIWTPPSGRRNAVGDEPAPTRVSIQWDAMRDALLAFFRLHGHCNVPDSWPANPNLPRWAHGLRRAKREGRLDETKIRTLDQIGFAWNATEARWNVMLAELARVLKTQPEGPKASSELSSWVAAVRRLKRAGKLSNEREHALEQIGFKWSPGDDRWNVMYELLKQYRQTHGDCSVPWKWAENPKLATWVATQRSFRKSGALSAERIGALESIGFAWGTAAAVRHSPKEGWNSMLERLAAFAATHGHARVPQGYAADRKLGSWVSTQRQRFRKRELSADQIMQLERIGFAWKVAPAGGTQGGTQASVFDERWGAMLAALTGYREKHGHCRVPTGWKTYPQLANWVAVQRSMRRRGKLSGQRIRALDEIGFVWNVTSSAPRPAQSSRTSPGTWVEMLAQLTEYKAARGNCLVPQRWKENRSLANWVSRLRVEYGKGLLSERQIAQLNSLGFDWDPIRARWEEKFAQLLQFKNAHGHTNVPQYNPRYAELATWVRNQRAAKRDARPIMKERAQRLDEIGFSWRLVESNPWESMFTRLEKFTLEHGHCNVPQKGLGDRKLGRWVNTQRLRFKHNRLSAERQKRLVNLGFVWNLKEKPTAK